MSIFTKITKALPFQLRKREPKPNIYDAGYGWLYPWLSPYTSNYGTDKAKSVQATWNTYYQAMNDEWVGACIDAYIVEALSAKFDVYSDDKESDDPDVVNYITDLFQRPGGPDGRETYTSFISRGISSLLGPGDFFAENVMDDTIRSLPVGLYFLQPHRLTYHYDTDQYGIIGTDIRYENDELIHVMQPDILNELWGKSPIDRCARSITMGILAGNFNKEFFESKMDPRAAIKFEKEMTEDQVTLSTNRLIENAKKNPRGHIILHGGDYQKITQTNRDLEFTTLLNMMRDRTISTYGVPPQNVGVYTAGSLGNERDNTADKKFKKRLQGKVFTPIEDEFKRVLGTSFDVWGWNEEFHFGDIDLEDKLQRAQIENVRLRNGSLTVNEVRTGYGEDPMDYGDMPMSYVTGPTYGNPGQEQVKQVKDNAYLVKSVLQQKGWLKSF